MAGATVIREAKLEISAPIDYQGVLRGLADDVALMISLWIVAGLGASQNLKH